MTAAPTNPAPETSATQTAPTPLPETPISTSEPTQSPTVETVTTAGVSLDLTWRVQPAFLKAGHQTRISWEAAQIPEGVDLADGSWEMQATLPEGVVFSDKALSSGAKQAITGSKGGFAVELADGFSAESVEIRVSLLQKGMEVRDYTLDIPVAIHLDKDKGGEASGLKGQVRVKIPFEALPDAVDVVIGQAYGLSSPRRDQAQPFKAECVHL